MQLGYEARCALPHAFDVILGSQLGVGAYRALVENHLDGVLVSVSGQLNLNYVPFEELVDPETLVTVVRFIQPRLRLPPPGAVPRELPARLSGSITPWHGAFASSVLEPLAKCACPGRAHFAITHRASSRKLGALPCISRPVRKILPAAQTQNRAVRVVQDDRQPDLPGRRRGPHRHPHEHQIRAGRREQRHAHRQRARRVLEDGRPDEHRQHRQQHDRHHQRLGVLQLAARRAHRHVERAVEQDRQEQETAPARRSAPGEMTSA